MKSIKKRSLCAVSCTLDIVGDKWSLLIIRDILFHDKHTFSEFLNSDEKIATNILTDRLQLLECHDIISKKPHPESKAKNFYFITLKGLDLLPTMLEMVLWSHKYYEISERARRSVELINTDREKLVQHITEKHRQFLL